MWEYKAKNIGDTDRMILEYNGPTPTTVEEAWIITIAKWGITIGLLHQGLPLWSNGGTNTCGLCLLGLKMQKRAERLGTKTCTHCPIKKDTGKPSCYGTPYPSWEGVDQYTPDHLPIAIAELTYLLGVYADSL